MSVEQDVYDNLVRDNKDLELTVANKTQAVQDLLSEIDGLTARIDEYVRLIDTGECCKGTPG